MSFSNCAAACAATITLHLYFAVMDGSTTLALNATTNDWIPSSVLPAVVSVDVTPSAPGDSFGITSVSIVPVVGAFANAYHAARRRFV
jgi:hypothetical protein